MEIVIAYSFFFYSTSVYAEKMLIVNDFLGEIIDD